MLTLFEHEQQNCALTARDVALLDQLQQRQSEQVLRHTPRRSGGWLLRAGQYVGVVRLGGQTIQILPKIYQSAESASVAQRAREATSNLLYMLSYAGLAQVNESDIADLLKRESDWFEILTNLFANHLRDEWRRGPARSYQRFEDEAAVLKGKWRLSEQFRRPGRAHRFDVAYDELTVDTELNRVFRFVVERLSRLTRSGVNARLLHELRLQLDDVTLLPVMASADVQHVTFDRLSQRYEPLLNMARLFLDGGALQMAAGATSLFAFVFDMNRVFEGFVAGFLARHRADALPPTLRSAALSAQARGWQLHLAQSQGRNVFRLKPDLLFRDGQRSVLIADTKYKLLDTGDRKLGISEADFYQMFAYAHRYECPRVLLLYPQGSHMQSALRRSFTLVGSNNTQVLAATIDIRRDLAKRSERMALAAELAAVLDGDDQ